MSVTIIIIILTCIISVTAFSNPKIIDDLIFYPPAIDRQKQWYRFFTNGFIHADIGHLAFNMLSLYLFGDLVEKAFGDIFGIKGKLIYILLYVIALAVCLIPTYSKNKENYYYKSLGASGAVSAVIFAGILLFPLTKIYLFFIPIGIPGFIFGPIYLFVSAYLSKKGGDNINHSAHIWGALFGVAYLVVLCYALSDFKPVQHFIEDIQSFFSGSN